MVGVDDGTVAAIPPRGRRATPAELVVVRDLIAAPLTRRSELIRASGLPRRTYQTTARRAAERQWVRPCYVPAPLVTGRPYALAMLLTPSAGARAELLADLERRPATSVCWAMGSSLLSVMFLPRPDTADRMVARWESAGLLARSVRVVVDTSEEGVRIYFDFEGEWSRYGGLEGSLGYPHAFRLHGEALGGSATELSAPARTVRDMMLRAAEAPADEVYGPSPLRGWGREWGERNALRNGWADARTFLDPFQIARSVSDFAAAVTFVEGTLRPEHGSAHLAESLATAAWAHPFLYLSDERSVMMAFLATGPATRLAPAPSRGMPVRAVLDRFLERFTVHREPIEGIRPVVDHRYEPLVGPPRPQALVAA